MGTTGRAVPIRESRPIPFCRRQGVRAQRPAIPQYSPKATTALAIPARETTTTPTSLGSKWDSGKSEVIHRVLAMMGSIQIDVRSQLRGQDVPVFMHGKEAALKRVKLLIDAQDSLNRDEIAALLSACREEPLCQKVELECRRLNHSTQLCRLLEPRRVLTCAEQFHEFYNLSKPFRSVVLRTGKEATPQLNLILVYANTRGAISYDIDSCHGDCLTTCIKYCLIWDRGPEDPTRLLHSVKEGHLTTDPRSGAFLICSPGIDGQLPNIVYQTISDPGRKGSVLP